jgi:hypothetical protein
MHNNIWWPFLKMWDQVKSTSLWNLSQVPDKQSQQKCGRIRQRRMHTSTLMYHNPVCWSEEEKRLQCWKYTWKC